MKLSKRYVLVLEPQADDLHLLRSWLQHLKCPMVVAHSMEQLVARVNQAVPSLVILTGDDYEWSQVLVEKLRHSTGACGVTIVALSDCHAPHWLYQEHNPGLDGFLVKPLSGDVLISLVQSAWARQACYATQ